MNFLLKVKNAIRIRIALDKRSYIGKHSYVGRGTVIRNATVGSFCCIGAGVRIGEYDHYLYHVSMHPFINEKKWGFITKDFYSKQATDCQKSRPIIGNDVWVGSNAIILRGVKIGNGAVIGAGSIVTHDIPPFAVAVGCPAKVIKYRFSESQIESINQSKWWEWDDKKIQEKIDSFYDINSFIDSLKECE